MRGLSRNAYVMAAQAIVVTCALGLGADARADDKKPGQPASGAAAVQGGESAEKLADLGFKAYEQGKFADAIALYLKAYQLSNDSRLLYNVASIYDKKLHDRDLADDFYRRYLKSPSTEPNLVKKANERVVELKGEQEAAREKEKEKEKEPEPVAAPPPPPPAPVAAPPPQHEKKAFPLRETGLIVGGAGVVLVVVGSAFGLAALSKSSDVGDDCPNDVCRHASSVGTRDTASHDATASTVFFGLGLAAIGGGVAMVLLDPKTKQKGPFRDLFSRAEVKCQVAGCALAGTF